MLRFSSRSTLFQKSKVTAFFSLEIFFLSKIFKPPQILQDHFSDRQRYRRQVIAENGESKHKWPNCWQDCFCSPCSVEYLYSRTTHYFFCSILLLIDSKGWICNFKSLFSECCHFRSIFLKSSSSATYVPYLNYNSDNVVCQECTYLLI